MSIDTTAVKNRRELKFNSLDEVAADARQLAAAPQVRQLGNHALGQVLAHLGIALDGSIDGLPFEVPWYRRWLAWLFRNSILYGSMSPGIKLPAEADKQVFPGNVTTEEGLAMLLSGLERFRGTTKRAAHPAFGELSLEEWNLLHQRHAELHLSFFVPE